MNKKRQRNSAPVPHKPEGVTDSCNLSAGDLEAEGSEVQDHPELHSEFLARLAARFYHPPKKENKTSQVKNKHLKHAHTRGGGGIPWSWNYRQLTWVLKTQPRHLLEKSRSVLSPHPMFFVGWLVCLFIIIIIVVIIIITITTTTTTIYVV